MFIVSSSGFRQHTLSESRYLNNLVYRSPQRLHRGHSERQGSEVSRQKLARHQLKALPKEINAQICLAYPLQTEISTSLRNLGFNVLSLTFVLLFLLKVKIRFLNREDRSSSGSVFLTWEHTYKSAPFFLELLRQPLRF